MVFIAARRFTRACHLVGVTGSPWPRVLMTILFTYLGGCWRDGGVGEVQIRCLRSVRLILRPPGVPAQTSVSVSWLVGAPSASPLWPADP